MVTNCDRQTPLSEEQFALGEAAPITKNCVCPTNTLIFGPSLANCMKTVVSVQCRMGSTRLPGKVLLPLGGERVVSWVLGAAERAGAVDEVVLAVGDRPENEAIVGFCERNDQRYIRGPEDDLVERHRQVIAETNADLLVRLTGDCPLLPASEIDRVIEEHLTAGVEYTFNDMDVMPVGTATDVLDPSVVRELSADNRTHPTKPLHADTDRWSQKPTHNEAWRHLSDVHMAVDTPGDYWTLSDAVDAVGNDPYEVATWITQNTDG